MADPLPPDQTLDESFPHDFLDAGLAAAFGPDSGPPLPAGGSVLQALSGNLPDVPRVQLREPAGEPVTPVNLPGSSEMPAGADRPDPSSRLQLYGEIARGGMGAILKGRDTDLGRDVAVKVLLETHAGKTELARRFIEEAQISGQLQHPGVTPVYELGVFSNRRPYFTMKLVKGQTLAGLLHQRKDLAEDRPKYLGIFVQVCHTLAYAHARGVIHRDLKPSNVMVGAYGEVQVMDWGLAKVLREGGVADEAKASREWERAKAASVIRTQRSAGTPEAGAPTQAGSVLGTPAYMAPEQARGDIDAVDERADVFGLGGILCEILTGRPPHAGKDRDALLRRAAQADLAEVFAALDGCGADPELVALARACLAPEPADRPRDGQAVAERVSAYLTGVEARAQAAQVARATAEARAEEAHKRQRLTVALALAVLLAAAGGGGGWLWVQHDRAERAAELTRRRQASERAAETSLAEADLLRRQGKWSEALAATRRAGELVRDEDSPELRQRLDRVVADLKMGARLEEIRLQHAERMGKDSQYDYAAGSRAFATAFRNYDLDVLSLDPDEAARRIAASEIKEQLIVALDDWARDLLEQDRAAMGRLLDVASRADPDDWRNRFRAELAQRNRQALTKLADRPEVRDLPPATVALLADALARAGEVGRAVKLLGQAQRRHPADFWLNHELAYFLQSLDPPGTDAALGFYRAALALRPTSPGTYHNLGRALSLQNKLDEAEAAFQHAVALQPDYSYAHNGLGVILTRRGRHAEAIAEFRQAVAAQPDNANAQRNLALTLDELGQHAEAVATWRALTRLRPTSADAFASLGLGYFNLRQWTEAADAFRRAVTLEPASVSHLSNLGLCLTEAGQYDAALAALDKAVRLGPNDAVAHKNRGLALQRKGDLPAAIAAYREAIRLRPEDSKAYSNLGGALLGQKKWAEAVVACEKAIALRPGNADAHHNLGLALFQQGRYEQASAAFRAALALRPLAGTYFHLALALERLERLDEAQEAYEQSIKREPDRPETYYNLGVILTARQRYAEAADAYRQAIRLAPKLEAAHCNLGLALEHQHHYVEAATAFRQAIQLDPEDALAHFGLGRVERELGHFESALASLRRAHELGSKQPSWNHPTTQWVLKVERLAELDRKRKAIERGEAEPADSAERIALAQFCTEPGLRLYAAAVRFYSAAFAADPRLADDPAAGHRYQAVCCALQAGTGQGADATPLNDPQRPRWRRQAVDWLRADLALERKRFDRGTPGERQMVQERLRRWQRDPDLAGVRDAAALAKLPEAERQAWQKLWADVAALLVKAEEPRK
jgi:serine/threonine-protein kinase